MNQTKLNKSQQELLKIKHAELEDALFIWLTNGLTMLP